MTEYVTNEQCACDDHEQEVRQAIGIEITEKGKLIKVGRILGSSVRHEEDVAIGGHSSFTGRSFEDLAALGDGFHSIFRCHRIGKENTVYRDPDG